MFAEPKVDGAIVERGVIGMLHLCQRLLPYKSDVAEPLLRVSGLILCKYCA
jgi:hypothetical protein